MSEEVSFDRFHPLDFALCHRMKSFRALSIESRSAFVFGLLVGLVAIAYVPPAVTFDGPSHFFRAVQISHGQFRSTRYSDSKLGGNVPHEDSQFIHTLWTSYWEKHNFLRTSDWSGIASMAPGNGQMDREEFTNTAVYSPANYVPQCIGMIASRIFTRSPLWEHRLACAANLACYLLLVVSFLEAADALRPSLVLIATSPLILIQAASENTDGVNFAIPVVLFALVWRLRRDPPEDCRFRLFLGFVLTLYIALLKPTEIACLGFLFFIPSACFGSRKIKLIWLSCSLFTAGAAWLCWNGPYFDVNIAKWFDPGHPPIHEQKAWLLSHPGDFARAFLNFIGDGFCVQWGLFYGGVGGWISDRLLYFLLRLSHYLLAVLLLIPLCASKRDLRWATANGLLAGFLLLFISVTLWVSYGVRDFGYIPYLGGRYLFLVYTFCIAAWSSLFNGWIPSLAKPLMCVGLIINSIGAGLILASIAQRTSG